LNPELDVLREWRDEVLLPSRLGMRFVAWYYAWSPHVAPRIATSPMLKRTVRALLWIPIWLLRRRFPGHRYRLGLKAATLAEPA
jgi:hypothetical protein